jgi:hypothetical protein
MDGIIYLLNQAGVALAQANQRIAQLEGELSSRRDESSPSAGHNQTSEKRAENSSSVPE